MSNYQEKLNSIIPVETVQERDIDLLILEEIKCNQNFTDWLLNNTINLNSKYELIGAWHSLTQVDLGESDIVFQIQSNEHNILFFIENKIDADFQPDQANRYKLRGSKKINSKECTEFHTILFAPNRYITKNQGFDFYITYEDLEDWFKNQSDLGLRAKYKANILKIAIEKQRRGYSPIINESVTDFRTAYFNYSNLHFPELGMTQSKNEHPKKAGFIRFKPSKLNLEQGEFIIHKQRGDVDLQLKRFEGNIDLAKEKFMGLLDKEMSIVKTNKSIVIRIKVPEIKIEESFVEQINKIKITLETVAKLYNWGKQYL